MFSLVVSLFFPQTRSKSKPCVFLGTPSFRVPFYILIISSKTSVSRHVKFVKNVFLFTSPPTSTTPVVDTDFAFSTLSYFLGDYPTSLTSSPSPTHPLAELHLKHPYRHPHPNCRYYPHYSTRPPSELHLTHLYCQPNLNYRDLPHHPTHPPATLPRTVEFFPITPPVLLST